MYRESKCQKEIEARRMIWVFVALPFRDPRHTVSTDHTRVSSKHNLYQRY